MLLEIIILTLKQINRINTIVYKLKKNFNNLFLWLCDCCYSILYNLKYVYYIVLSYFFLEFNFPKNQ